MLSQCMRATHDLPGKSNETLETIMKLHLCFDRDRWWKIHGNVVRDLLESRSNFEIIGNPASPSCQMPTSKDLFELTYAIDAIYQDLYIDCPPCRDTLKLSFQLINQYWDIEIIRWDSPFLMTTSPMNHSEKNSREASFNHEGSDYSNEDIAMELKGSMSSSNNTIVLRVPYAAKQRPCLSFLPSIFRKMLKFLELEYDGWIDLYLRPISLSKATSSDIRNNWKIFRHDDRIRVDPPSLFLRYYPGIKKQVKGEDVIDALTLIEQTTFISTLFQGFRRAHGIAVQYFAKRK